jgi:hypothetical protein
MIDGVAAMSKFLRIAVTEPDIAKVRHVCVCASIASECLNTGALCRRAVAGAVHD